MADPCCPLIHRLVFLVGFARGDKAMQCKLIAGFAVNAAVVARYSLRVRSSNFALVVYPESAAAVDYTVINRIDHVLRYAGNHKVFAVIVKEELRLAVAIVTRSDYLPEVVDVHWEGLSSAAKGYLSSRKFQRSEVATVVQEGHLTIIVVDVAASGSVM